MICHIGHFVPVQAQSKLYPRLFDLQEVRLEESVFKQAMDLNYRTLLEYDTDRLLTPYFRQAGFSEWEKEHPNFPNWGSGGFRLDGHVGGHYLSALALAYASASDEVIKAEMKERMDYMVDKMAECQDAFNDNTEGLYGYIGGLPDNSVWTGIYKKDLTAFNNNRGNVPFYVLHKIYAGLRDAWIYGNNEKAKACFLKMCDWGINLIAGTDDATLQDILNTEHGGINEMYADAYHITGEKKYLEAAKRYSHQTMVTNMQTENHSFLDNKHANTQVPKYVGFARIAQEGLQEADGASASYRAAAQIFWNEVTKNRTVAIGGNSVDEHFLPTSRSAEYINNPNGPESCNTNNMLKLTEDLFADRQDAGYADFYEQAMLNHILSTQNPNTGGYVYFTSLRPRHFRVYSQVNQGMWCCVGTGMENHSKYGEFIYAHSPRNDSLFVNLFVASRLNNEHFGLTQSTSFPYGEKTTLTINKGGKYVLAVRHPSWCKEGYTITVNGTDIEDSSSPGTYAYLDGTWNEGDSVEISFPMKMEIVACPGYDRYIAFRYGPVVLGAKTGTEDMDCQFAGEGRMDHAPSNGKQLSLTSAPILVGPRENVVGNIETVDKGKLQFKINAEAYNDKKFADLILQPFFSLHECRYMVYWNQISADEWGNIKEQLEAEEQAAQYLQERTLDFVATGEQQSDAGHVLQGQFEKGSYADEFYVDALSGKWFSYVLATQGVSKDVSLFCRYHSADKGRTCTIYINNKVFKEVTLDNGDANGFYNVEYLIPEDFLKDEDGNAYPEITVKFSASGSSPTPGLYYLRLLKDYRYPQPYAFACYQWVSGDDARVSSISYDRKGNTVKVYGYPGDNNICLQMDKAYNDSSFIRKDQKYLLVKGTDLAEGNGKAYLWWLNGANHGTQVAPDFSTTSPTDGQTTFVWDVTKSGITDFMQGDSIGLSNHGKSCSTLFGLTSNAEDNSSTITDINFCSMKQIAENYPGLIDVMGINVFDEKSRDFKPTSTYHNVVVKKAFRADEWTALCLPFAMGRTLAKDYFTDIKTFTGLQLSDDGTLTLYFEDAANISQGNVYLVRSLKDMDNMELSAVQDFATTDPEALTNADVTLQGIYSEKVLEKPVYVFKEGAFYVNDSETAINGLNFYAQLTGEALEKLRQVVFSFDKMPDGIHSLKAGKADKDIYTINGIKIRKDGNESQTSKHLPQGLYIIGSKKVIHRGY